MKKMSAQRFLSAFLALALVLSSFVWIPPVEVKAASPATLNGLTYECDFYKKTYGSNCYYFQFTGDKNGTVKVYSSYNPADIRVFSFTYDAATGSLTYPDITGTLQLGSGIYETLDNHRYYGIKVDGNSITYDFSGGLQLFVQHTHSGTWTTVTQPTVSATGMKQNVCPVCGLKETVVIAKLTPPKPVERTDINFAVSAKAKKNYVALKWGAVPGASSYTVYYSLCDSKNSYVQAGVTGGTGFTLQNLNQKVNYKVFVKANFANNAIANSYVSHVAMPKSNRTNPKSLKLKFKKATLKVGKTKKIKVTVAKKSKKKFLGHEAKFRYYSANPKVATVSAAGKIKAVAKGKANIIVITENGLTKTVKVTVK